MGKNLCPFHHVWEPDCDLCEVDTINGAMAESGPRAVKEEDVVVEDEQPVAVRPSGVWTGQGALPLD